MHANVTLMLYCFPVLGLSSFVASCRAHARGHFSPSTSDASIFQLYLKPVVHVYLDLVQAPLNLPSASESLDFMALYKSVFKI